MEYPEGWDQLSKHERKEFKRNFYRDQQLKQSHLGQIKKYSVIAFVGLLVLVGGYLLVKEMSKPQPGEFVTSLGNKHIENLTDAHDPYNSIPPTSGTHVGGKAQWGISDAPIPDELQLHNLEDGGVGIQYNCTPGVDQQNSATPSAEVESECKQLVDNLATIAKKYPDKVFMAPYPKLDTKIALTAWTRIDKFSDFDSDRMQIFIKAFKGIDHH
ncbi:MAG: DUF3105 domain-containing protein [Patescibacteria group bacterium]